MIGKRALVVIANQTLAHVASAAFALSRDDDFRRAKLRVAQQLGDVCPTTSVLRDGRLYVVHSKLNALIQAAAAQEQDLQVEAPIESIARIARCTASIAPACVHLTLCVDSLSEQGFQSSVGDSQQTVTQAG